MEKDYVVWKIFVGYLLVILLMIMSGTVSGQSPCDDDGLCVVQFNAGFNEGNKVTWVGELEECKTLFIDIQKDATSSAKYKIVVIPTILIFNGDEEVGRFQANIMMQLEATQGEVQEAVDEIIMSAF